MEFALTGLPLPLRIRPSVPMTDAELMVFCAKNDFYNIEREPDGGLIVTLPHGAESAHWNAGIVVEIASWNRKAETGIVFSHAGFTLPDGSVRSADLAWLSNEKWHALSLSEQERFAPVCPEFLIELRSPFEALPELQRKMDMWMTNGAQLAWLIDPQEKAVTIYRPGQAPERLDHISQVSGEGPVAGFVLPLDRMWGPSNADLVGSESAHSMISVEAESLKQAVTASGPETTVEFRTDWYCHVLSEGTDPRSSGVYEWRIDGVGVYVGKALVLQDRIKAYPNNVRRMIAGHSWHGDSTKKYRPIHYALREAHDEGRTVSVVILENCSSSERAERERWWIEKRRSEALAGGLPVLNA